MYRRSPKPHGYIGHRRATRLGGYDKETSDINDVRQWRRTQSLIDDLTEFVNHIGPFD
jgi:hypothetical protein